MLEKVPVTKHNQVIRFTQQNDKLAKKMRSFFLNQQHISMNKINPKKLRNSKWTAVTPLNKEKHFIVSEITFDEENIVISCSIEAVISKRSISIDWTELRDDCQWLHGWK